eukprot:765998-Hanusia_phi.AAC.3
MAVNRVFMDTMHRSARKEQQSFPPTESFFLSVMQCTQLSSLRPFELHPWDQDQPLAVPSAENISKSALSSILNEKREAEANTLALTVLLFCRCNVVQKVLSFRLDLNLSFCRGFLSLLDERPLLVRQTEDGAAERSGGGSMRGDGEHGWCREGRERWEERRK